MVENIPFLHVISQLAVSKQGAANVDTFATGECNDDDGDDDDDDDDTFATCESDYDDDDDDD